MRLFVIEKKVAKRYASGKNQDTGSHDSNEREETEESDSDDEEEPLLGREMEKYEIPPGQPALIRKVPVLYCFRDLSLIGAFLIALVQAILISTFDASIATEGEEVFGFDSLKSGLLFIPIGVVDLIIGPLAGWAVDKYGTKPAGVFGFSFLVPVLVALRAIDHGSKEQLILYCALLALCGIGLASIGAPSIVEAGTVVQIYHKANPEFFGENGPYAQLYGMNSMIFSVGLTIGPLIAGGLKSSIGYGNMNAVIAAICFLTALVTFVYVGGKPKLLRK